MLAEDQWSEYLRILGKFCVRAGTPVDIEKCTSSKTERDTKIAELMTTAPPTKPITNSSMHPGLMALRWHGEMQEPRLHRGQGSIFVVRVCHSAAATKTMPSAAAFQSLLQPLQSQWHHLVLLPHLTRKKSKHRAASLLPSIYAATYRHKQACKLLSPPHHFKASLLSSGSLDGKIRHLHNVVTKLS